MFHFLDCIPNDAECIWRQEFNNWCKIYDEYSLEFNIWKCVKVGENSVIPFH